MNAEICERQIISLDPLECFLYKIKHEKKLTEWKNIIYFQQKQFRKQSISVKIKVRKIMNSNSFFWSLIKRLILFFSRMGLNQRTINKMRRRTNKIRTNIYTEIQIL